MSAKTSSPSVVSSASLLVQVLRFMCDFTGDSYKFSKKYLKKSQFYIDA